VHARMQVVVEMLVAAMERAGSVQAVPVAKALAGLSYDGHARGVPHAGTMRREDHQFLQPIYVSVMQKAGSPGVRFDVEGSGYGFRTVRYLSAAQTALPHHCKMAAF
jgi:branched-chain amino acid transport system substrate-binding protein